MVPLAPALASVWQLPQPLAVNAVLPAATSPPPPVLEPPLLPPPGVLVAGVDADETAAVESERFSPRLLEFLVDSPAATITTIITTMPTTVPRSAAIRTFTMSAVTIPSPHAGIYRKEGMCPPASNAELEPRCWTNATSRL